MFLKVIQYGYETLQNVKPALLNHIIKTSNLELNLSLESAKLHTFRALAPARLTHHWYAPACLYAFTLINGHLTRLCLVTNTVVSVGPRAKKFNMVRNNYGHTQRCEFSVLPETPFLGKLGRIKIVSLSWNLLPRPVRICRIQWWCSRFLFPTRNTFFG